MDRIIEIGGRVSEGQTAAVYLDRFCIGGLQKVKEPVIGQGNAEQS